LDSTQKVKSIVDQKIEDLMGDPQIWGVGHGLRGTSTGDTIFSVWHSGSLKGFLGGVFSKNINSVPPDQLLSFCMDQSGGWGAYAKHTIVQIISGEYRIRRSDEPGLLWDVSHIGDFIFGLTSDSVWREPYLHSEKRETLRSHLGKNQFLNKDKSEEALFWFVGDDSRVYRLGLTDIKAKPTTLRLPGSTGIERSSASSFDGWLYLICDNSSKVVRVRRNPVSAVEEIQEIVSVEDRIEDLCVVENESSAALWVATSNGKSVSFLSAELKTPEDPEDRGDVAKFVKQGELPGVSGVSQLTVAPNAGSKKLTLWCGVGSWHTLAENSEKSLAAPQLLRIEL
jgi:hypothetical protein